MMNLKSSVLEKCSSVVIFSDFIIPTGILHEATGTSFNKTEQEPQEPLEQPHFTEVQPLFCNTFIRFQSGSTSRIFSSSFKITGIFNLSLFFILFFKSPNQSNLVISEFTVFVLFFIRLNSKSSVHGSSFN